MVKELDRCGDEEKWEEASDHSLISHPEMVFVEPHGVVQPFSEI